MSIKNTKQNHIRNEESRKDSASNVTGKKDFDTWNEVKYSVVTSQNQEGLLDEELFTSAYAYMEVRPKPLSINLTTK